METLDFESKLRALEAKAASAQSAPKAQQRTIVDDILELISNTGEDVRVRIFSDNRFKDVDYNTDAALLSYIKNKYAKEFSLTEEGKSIYGEYIEMYKSIKHEIEEVEMKEFLEWKKQKNK